MENFWGFNVWGVVNLFALLLLSLLAANALKRKIRILQASLIPTSVLGGLILLLISGVYKLFTGDLMFDTPFFGGNGMEILETITYHALALGFIASALKTSKNKLTKKRSIEIFDTGVTTVSTYLLQAILGLGITIVAAMLIKDFFSAAGLLLPFGYGQGTGQAMNWGGIYEFEHGFDGGKSFGLTVATLGFISASLGGVFHLHRLKRQGKYSFDRSETAEIIEDIQSNREIPMEGSVDKMTVQIALVVAAYFIAYLMMYVLGGLLPGLKSVIFGFNFLLGVIAALIVKGALNLLHKSSLSKREYINNFLLTRISNFCFDIMIVAGVAAIRLGILQKYWGVLLIMGTVGLAATYLYNYFVAKTLFKDYVEEQFLTMFGMLTGTASTGVVLLREIDGEFKTPAAENMVYQTLPAIVFGFPIMLLAALAPDKPIFVLILVAVLFVIMNIILFRSKIFKKKKSEALAEDE
ncbi:MAG: hypothetical protein IKL72_03185 [Firmicutes bacterium]|nr:hypothetical protein [Bacillota bacterium]